MLCLIKTSDQTAVEVARLLSDYRLSLDAFLRANLDYLEVVLPSIPGLAPQTGGSEKPNFAEDVCLAMLPCLTAGSEFSRVGAHLNDTILGLQSQRHEVKVMHNRSGKPPLTSTPTRPSHGLANPFIHHSEVQHYFTTSELSELESAGERLEHPYLFHPGPILRGGRAIGTTLDLNDDLRSLPALRGLEIVRPDIERWLPLLQYYDLAPRELSLGTIINAEDGTAILAGFSSLLSDLTEVVCFGFACNQSLPGVSYREDLVAIHERGRRLAAAWKRARLEVEVAIHQLNGHSKVMVRALLLLASGVAVGEDIFGEPGIMRQQESEASTNPLTPSPSKIRLVPRITEDYY